MSSIYLPSMGQEVDIELYRIAKAIEAYDSRLFLAPHPHNGDLTVFVSLAAVGEPPWPVFGLAAVPSEPGSLPSPDAVVKRLATCDTSKVNILRAINKNNDQIKSEQDAKLLDRRRQSYEMLEFHMRDLGLSPTTVSTRPRVRG